MKTKTKSLKQVVTFKASPHEIYEMLMDPKKHAAFTGAAAKISRKIGSAFTAHGSWITGKQLKLIPNRLIVQAWRGADWPKGHHSKAMFLITKTKTGTKLIFRQTGVPIDAYLNIKKGWYSEYWVKMKKMLGEKKKPASKKWR
jgi:activator of HSP90 ATPase